MTLTTLGYAFFGGLLPSCIWLYILLREDASHPEPRKLIVFAFIVGMLAVLLALPLEHYAENNLTGGQSAMTLAILIAWALIEETLKYGMAAALILWRPAVDEAPDYVIYLITVALGFASAENMLFLLSPLMDNNTLGSVFTGDVRFLGSTLLHVVASAAIGFSLAFSGKSRPHVRVAAAAGGLILAVALHTAFNALIINESTSMTLAAFFFVWVAVVVFFAAFEVLKYFQYRNFPTNT